ncbi:MAG: transglycosylase SLT domain-containing protein [Gammaproteobacteria bacterium]|nr:transglycosylase SLT domain-containing protein [Gammaproteobacteria bacterium]MCW5582401.1 transglycosylase SLT domain-containing protein [Gammaproteobacteria bacterium]
MQLVTNITKYLILAVLSSYLLTTWYADETLVMNLTPANYSEGSVYDTEESVWDTLSREFSLDNRAQSAQVQAEIRKLLADQDRFYNILKAASPYIYFIHKQTKARGLPAEIALIPIIESEFNPNDKSKVGATGLWQLMSQTAHELGVKVKSGYDGRRNVIASTRAALAYFNDLGKYFNGNWYLAIAAYNCGQVRVKSAIRKTGTDSFWNLPLPKETKYYVPKLLAVAAIVKNPEKYGVELPPISNKPYFTELKVKEAVSLSQVSKSSGVSMETLSKLNPDYTHGSTPKAEINTLLVPIEKASTVKAQLGV